MNTISDKSSGMIGNRFSDKSGSKKKKFKSSSWKCEGEATEDQILDGGGAGVELRIRNLEADVAEYKQNNRELSNISIHLQKENEFLHNELRKDPARKIPDSQDMHLTSISQKKLFDTEEFEKIIIQKEQLVDLTDALLTENTNLQAQLNNF